MFAGRVKIVSHSSCIKIFLTPGIELVTVTMDESDQLDVLTALTEAYINVNFKEVVTRK